MPLREWRVIIQDAIEAGERIDRALKGVTFDRFCTSEVLLDATVRNLSVIGECCRLVPQNVKSSHPEIPWPLVAGMRNLVIHEYFRVSKEIVWEAATAELPVLLAQLRATLD